VRTGSGSDSSSKESEFLTERVSTGIINTKHRFGLAAFAVLAVLALVPGCAQKGNPVEPPGELGGYRIAGQLALGGYAEDLEVTGDLCLIAASQGGLVFVDVSDPEAPTQLSVAVTRYPATGCSYIASDSLAVVTIGEQGVYLYDVSDLSNPVWLSGGQGGDSRDVITRERTPGVEHDVLIADGYGLKTQRCYYWEALQQWYLGAGDDAGGMGVSRGICGLGTYALIAREELGLAIFEAADITNVSLVGAVDTPGEARGVAANGSYAYVADWREGLQVVDVSDPANPVIVGSAETDGLANGIAYRDGRVFVASHAGGLEVFDVTDPEDPVAVGHLATPFANEVFATDNYIFVADRDWGLVIAEEE
jgi:hypothetical protein